MKYIKKTSKDGGSYYTSALARQALLEACRACDQSRFKKASLGGEQEQGFEQAFASLAYTYLKDKAPRLLDFVVGFQLVDRNQDNTKAMGVFGCKVGEQWLYCPMFFVAGKLEGHELLYIQKQDAFVPLKENWVNYLISKKPYMLGKGSQKNHMELGAAQPDLRWLRESALSKRGSDTPSYFQRWAEGFVPFYAAVKKHPDKVLAKFASLREEVDLRRFLTHPVLLKNACELAAQYPMIREGFDVFYGLGFLEKMQQQVKQASAYLLPPDGEIPKIKNVFRVSPQKRRKPETKRKILPDLEEDKQEDPIKSGALKIEVRQMTVSAQGDKLPSVEHFKEMFPEFLKDVESGEKQSEDRRLKKEAEFNDQLKITDNRQPNQVSKLMDKQLSQSFSTPTAAGIYKVVMPEGRLQKLVVLPDPLTTAKSKKRFLLIDPESTKCRPSIITDELFADSANEDEARTAFLDYVKNLPTIGDLNEEDMCVAIAPDGSEWSSTFRIWSKRPGKLFSVNYDSYTGASFVECREENKRIDNVEVVDGNIKKLTTASGKLYIPSNYKIVRIADSYDSSGGPRERIKPGNLSDIQRVIFEEKFASLDVQKLGAGRYKIASVCGLESHLTKQQAIISLVGKHGLDQDTAAYCIKAAEDAGERNQASFFIKHAFGFGMSSRLAPGFPEPEYGSEPSGNGSVNTIYPQEESIPVDALSSSNTDPARYDPFYLPDQQAITTAQQAANSGDKEIFDVSMLKPLLKTVSQDSIVDDALGPLMQALNKLGTLLFALIWHAEDFEERYGKQDIPELKDSIRNTFEALGDVCLYIKEKTVGGGALDMPGVGSVDAEPNVDEVARN